eukprot:m.171010 g.171010  ORF g.171010 m.171010 type:complete len:194 (+) comp14805_c0_seq4:43-624(+)
MGCCDSKEEEAASTERSPLLNTSPASPGKRMTVVLEEPTPSKILIGSQDNKNTFGQHSAGDVATTKAEAHAAREAFQQQIENDLIDVVDRAAQAFVITVPEDISPLVTSDEAEQRQRSYARAISNISQLEPPAMPTTAIGPAEIDAVLRAPVMPNHSAFTGLLSDLSAARTSISVAEGDSIYFDLKILGAPEA